MFSKSSQLCPKRYLTYVVRRTLTRKGPVPAGRTRSPVLTMVGCAEVYARAVHSAEPPRAVARVGVIRRHETLAAIFARLEDAATSEVCAVAIHA